MSGTKRKFSREFKLQVVQEVESGLKSRAQATREHELSEGMINKWVSAYRADPVNAFTGKTMGPEKLANLKLRSGGWNGPWGEKPWRQKFSRKPWTTWELKRGAL